MLTLRQIRVALADQISNHLARPTNVTAYVETDQYPLIELRPPAGDFISYFESMGSNGAADFLLDIHIFVAGTGRSAQEALDDYLSVGEGNTSSVVDAVMSDKTLGGLVQTIRLLNATGYLRFPEGCSARLPCEIVLFKRGAQV